MSVLKQITSLYQDGLYSNVVHLAELSIAPCDQNTEIPPYNKFQIYIFYADSLYNLQRYLQADKVYNQALQLRKYIIKTKNTSNITENQNKELLSDVEIKYRIYLCCIRLKLKKKALEVLQSISARSRPAKVNMALGDLYSYAGMERSAATSYKDVLRQNPCAIEAAENLLKLGVKGVEVNSLTFEASTELNWINTWLKGQAHMHAKEYLAAINTFKSMEALKDNTMLLVTIAYCCVYLGDEKTALQSFQRVLHLDPNFVTGRDLFANLLAHNGEKGLRELEKLTTIDIDLSQWSCEHWVVMGWHMYALKKYDKAAYFGQQAISMYRKNVEALLLKGSTFMHLLKFPEAHVNFKDVIQYAPNRIEGHKGLVDCNLGMSRVRVAQAMAENACKQLNNSAPALSLYATALMHDPVAITKVRPLLDKAYAADPSYLPTVYLLLKEMLREDRNAEAVTFLKKYVQKYPSSKAHHLLAEHYQRMQNYDDANDHYTAALRLEPDTEQPEESFNALGLSKGESSYYMSAAGTSTYPSQGPSVPTDDLEESDSDQWPSNVDV